MDQFNSRRSACISLHGVAASSQPLASTTGLNVLQQGGNAADAAVAMAAVLNLTEPCSTGIGGDCFCLYYDAKAKTVSGLNGSGRSPQALTLDRVREAGIQGEKLPWQHAFTVTVPGAAAGWVDTIERFGSMKLKDVLAPAIKMAQEGVPIHHVAAHSWQRQQDMLAAKSNPHAQSMLLEGKAPAEAEVMVLNDLADTFQRLADHGKAGFYQGPVAEAIVECVAQHAGCLSMEDLRAHQTTFDEPIKARYKDVELWEIPPNGQGLTALIALNILNHLPLDGLAHNSTLYLHYVIEAVRLAFADTTWYIADPAVEHVPVAELLSDKYARERAAFVSADRALDGPAKGSPTSSSDTVYFTVVDDDGNACSFINSNYMGFGTGLVPKGCGFTLQNRGANFVLEDGHPNCLAPNKRPYHTIIPGMVTQAMDNELYCTFGVMGGFMQPQGHVQVLLNMRLFGMDPQRALDAPRFCVGPGHEGAAGGVALEEGIPADVMQGLKQLGHDVTMLTGYDRARFGRGQIVKKTVQKASDGTQRRVWVGGSDPRGDGQACGY